MRDDEKMLLLNELYLLDKGVRDCFLMTICGDEETINESLDYIIGQVISHKYYMYTYDKNIDPYADEENNKLYDVYVCKYNYQKLILHKIHSTLDHKSILYEYCIGTMLGYSGKSMDEFITKIITNKGITELENKKEDDITVPI